MQDEEQNKARRNGTKVHHEPYTRERLEAIKRLIQNFEQQGRKKRYSIIVDSELIVPTTSDADNFDNYMDYLEPHTEEVEIRTFFGDSPNCNRYIFHLKQMPQQPGLGSAPADTNSQIQEALEKQKLETKIMLLEQELKRKRKKLRNYKELQGQLDDKQIDIKDLLVKGMELYGQIKGSPPGGSAVQGLPPAEVDIEAELSPADQHYHDLKEQYGDKHLERALKLWEVFMKHPELREEFSQLITAKNKEDG